MSNPGVHAVVVEDMGRIFMRSHHDSEEEAKQAAARTIDLRAVHTVPAVVELASNGNVRYWNYR